MRTALRLALALVILIHGVLHLPGAGESPVWIAAALLVAFAGAALAVGPEWWWIAVAVAAVSSQALVATSWSDAGAGTVVNVVMLVAAGYGYAVHGPRSLRARYRRLATTAVARADALPVETVAESDLAGLPAPLAAYLRTCGVVGRPRVTSFRATVHGRIRGGPDEPWMRFTGEQVNTFGPHPDRFFHLEATRLALPIDVLHVQTDRATMTARLCGIAPVLDSAGPDLDRAETVTLFNDMCLLAPGALLDADVDWETVDDRCVRGTFRRGGHQVSADLVFDFDHDLVDFESGDRLRASADGKTFTRTRWSTPVQEYASYGGRRLLSRADAVWHPKPPEVQFAYLELVLDDIAYNSGPRLTPEPVETGVLPRRRQANAQRTRT